MKKLYKLSLLLVAIMILTMSAASAADTNDMADVISEEESNSLELDESLSEAEASGNDDVLLMTEPHFLPFKMRLMGEEIQ